MKKKNNLNYSNLLNDLNRDFTKPKKEGKLNPHWVTGFIDVHL